MAQRPTADYPIDANTTSGTDLSLILNRFQSALESGNSGSSRPAYITAGGLWVKEGDPMELYLYDGTADQLLYDTSNGINVTEGLWTLVDSNDEAGEIQRPSDVLIDGNLTVTGDLVDGNGDPISIIDPAAVDGVVATWDDTAKQWTPDSSLTIDATGNATFSGTARFETLDNPLMLRGGEDVYSIGVGIKNVSNNVPSASVIYNAWQTHYFEKSDSSTFQEVIYCDGNATFSGDISTGSGSPATAEARYTNLYMLGDDKDFGSRIFMSNSNNDWAVTSFGGGAVDRWSVYSFSQAKNVLQLDGDTGNATFSGAVNTYGDFISTSTPSGGYFTASGNFAGESQAAGMVMVRPSQKVNNFITCTNTGHGGVPVFSVGSTGNTRAAGQQLIGTRDLIETLHTLREATKDESTIEGLRDAIGDAIGGLIQKFEAMQAEAKEKLEEAYNQTGTQEITPDKGTKDDKPEAGTLDLEE